MAQLGTLLTGAGVTTVITGQAQTEAFLVLGGVDTANPLQGLVVEIDGQPYININDNAALIEAYAKWMTKFVGPSNVGLVFKIATGSIQQSTTYRLTNAGATTPTIFAWSDNNAGIPFVVGTKQVNASSYQDFQKFSALMVGTPANLTSAEIVYNSGRKATLTALELGAQYAMKAPSEAFGYLGGVAIIDNTDQSIRTVRLNCSAANTILVAKIPDAAFAVLQGK